MSFQDSFKGLCFAFDCAAFSRTLFSAFGLKEVAFCSRSLGICFPQGYHPFFQFRFSTSEGTWRHEAGQASLGGLLIEDGSLVGICLLWLRPGWIQKRGFYILNSIEVNLRPYPKKGKHLTSSAVILGIVNIFGTPMSGVFGQLPAVESPYGRRVPRSDP